MKVRNLKYFLASTVMLISVHGAYAKTTNWGGHDSLEVTTDLVAPGSFSDVIKFTLQGPDYLASTTVSNNLLSTLNITGGKVSLYEKNGLGANQDLMLGSYTFNGETGDISTTFYAPSKGKYYYLVEGISNGSSGGFYSLTSTPLPEPQSWAMAVAGTLIAFTMHRRNGRK